METFKLSHQQIDDVTVIICSGRFDAFSVPSVKEVLDSATAQPPANILVDLSGSGFIDSSALSALVSGMKRARLQEGDLILCALQQPVRIIFELTRLDRAFTIVENRAAGLQTFAELSSKKR